MFRIRLAAASIVGLVVGSILVPQLFSKEPTQALHLEILTEPTKGVPTKFKLPTIVGLSSLELAQSGLIDELQSHGVRVLFENVDDTRVNRKKDARRVVRATSTPFEPGDVVVIQTNDPRIGN